MTAMTHAHDAAHTQPHADAETITHMHIRTWHSGWGASTQWAHMPCRTCKHPFIPMQPRRSAVQAAKHGLAPLAPPHAAFTLESQNHFGGSPNVSTMETACGRSCCAPQVTAGPFAQPPARSIET
jgi:hypothetical protein